MSEEKEIWSGSPSQVLNMRTFLICGVLIWTIVPLFILVWKWLELKSVKYELTSQRLKTSYGVLNKQIDELELYRIKDYRLEQPFFLRLFSLGNIILDTSDKSHPMVTIRAISHPHELKDNIRHYVEECRKRKGVHEIDFE